MKGEAEGERDHSTFESFLFIACLGTETNETSDRFTLVVHHTLFLSLGQRGPKVHYIPNMDAWFVVSRASLF